MRYRKNDNFCPTKPQGFDNNSSRHHPCDKTKFGIYEGEYESPLLYGRTPGKTIMGHIVIQNFQRKI